MNIILLVACAMLAAVGLTDVIARAVCRLNAPCDKSGVYRVIRLKKSPALIEDQMRYELLLLSWCAHRQPGRLVFIDDGLGEDERLLAKRLLSDFNDATLCSFEELRLLVKGQ
jgi:hypothetical protein